MKYLKILASIIVLTSLLACQSKLLTVHKIDVQQGNALDAEMVDKVEIGMTQEQVQYVLGSPLISDSFHPDRWDYIYLFIPGYGEKERRQLTLIFDRGEVIEIDKHNIVESELAGTTTENSGKKDEQNETDEDKEAEKEELSEKEKTELKELEEQADVLEDVEDALDSNAPLDN